jgi:hypothetical protein
MINVTKAKHVEQRKYRPFFFFSSLVVLRRSYAFILKEAHYIVT